MNQNYRMCINIINVIFYLKHKSLKNIGLEFKSLEQMIEEINFSLNTMNEKELISTLNNRMKKECCNQDDLIYLSNFYSNVYIDLLNQSSPTERIKIFFDLIIKSYSYNSFADNILKNTKYKQSYLTIFHKYKYLNKLKVANQKQKLYDIIKAEFNKRKD